LSRKKLGNIFQDFKNVTLATSNGLVYSLGENLREVLHHRKPHLNRSDSLNVENPVTTLSFGNTTTNIVKIETEDDRVWEYIPGNIDWKAVNAIAEPILTKFTFRTNGTCISSRFPGIGWSYFGADPEWGSKQANQLTIELEAALAKHDVKITTLIPGSIEIVPTTLKKGNVVSLLLNYILACRAGRLPAMLTIIGDEDVDDGMFEVFSSLFFAFVFFSLEYLFLSFLE
jgi:trehalose-6-phosphatase